MSQTITFLSKWFDSDFETLIAPKLREAFPEITFQHQQERQLTFEHWMKKENVDIVIFYPDSNDDLKSELSVTFDPSVLPLDTYHPDFVHALTDEKGNLYGVPFSLGTCYTHALFYNKDLFDAFHVPYPKHGMSWDEIIALSRQVSGIVHDKIVYGLDLGDPSLIKMQLGFTFLDPVTHEPKLREPECEHFFQIIREAYRIPGNLQDSNERLFAYGRAFLRKGNVAMSIHSPETFGKRQLPFKLGAVTFPKNSNSNLIIPSLPGLTVLYAHPNTVQVDLVKKVMVYLASDEFQHHSAALGKFPAKIGPTFEEAFGQHNVNFAGESMTWLFEGEKRGWPDPQSPYESEAAYIIRKEMEFAVRGWRSWKMSIAAMESNIKQMLESKQITT